MLRYYKNIWLRLGGTISSCRDEKLHHCCSSLWLLTAAFWDFLANLAKDEKYIFVESGKAETKYTEEQFFFSDFRFTVKLQHKTNVPTSQRCSATNWSRDEEQNNLQVFCPMRSTTWHFRMICIRRGDVAKLHRISTRIRYYFFLQWQWKHHSITNLVSWKSASKKPHNLKYLHYFYSAAKSSWHVSSE